MSGQRADDNPDKETNKRRSERRRRTWAEFCARNQGGGGYRGGGLGRVEIISTG